MCEQRVTWLCYLAKGSDLWRKKKMKRRRMLFNSRIGLRREGWCQGVATSMLRYSNGHHACRKDQPASGWEWARESVCGSVLQTQEACRLQNEVFSWYKYAYTQVVSMYVLKLYNISTVYMCKTRFSVTFPTSCSSVVTNLFIRMYERVAMHSCCGTRRQIPELSA